MNKELKQSIKASEYNKLFRSNLKSYKAAVWAMANIVHFGSQKFGRDMITQMTCWDESKVNYFNSIVKTVGKHIDILPEVVFEIASTNDKEKWLIKAKKEGLKVSQIRRLIRECQATFKQEKQLQGVSSVPRMLILLENELKRVPADQREAVKEKIRQLTGTNA
jgi:hypothetical protein